MKKATLFFMALLSVGSGQSLDRRYARERALAGARGFTLPDLARGQYDKAALAMNKAVLHYEKRCLRDHGDRAAHNDYRRANDLAYDLTRAALDGFDRQRQQAAKAMLP